LNGISGEHEMYAVEERQAVESDWSSMYF
jgi:hypothetical protein